MKYLMYLVSDVEEQQKLNAHKPNIHQQNNRAAEQLSFDTNIQINSTTHRKTNII